MPFEIIRGDVTELMVDAIVNAANPKPVVGWGVDAGIHQKAGPKLLAAREKIGAIPVGQAAVTPGFDLPSKYVIHAVGPVWGDGTHGEAALLRQTYDCALAAAAKKKCKSVAFPLLSSGNYGFPKDVALQTAVAAFSAFLMDHDISITLAVFDKAAFDLSGKLFASVRSYIDEHYIQSKLWDEYGGAPESVSGEVTDALLLRQMERRRNLRAKRTEDLFDAAPMAAPPTYQANILPSASAPAHVKKAKHTGAQPTLEELLKQTDAGFSETLLKLIDRTGKKDSDIYKKANIDRKLFSKIHNNPSYKPTKPTALAFAIALELSLEETRDFIGRAGYALTHSSKFDIIVEYFIVNRNYDVFAINEALFAFDQPLIGGNAA